jgi:host factor-I protein
MKASGSEQDLFLDSLIGEHVEASVYLINGVRLKGTIHSYDHNVVLIGSDRGFLTIFKHSVSTIQVGEHKRRPGAQVITGDSNHKRQSRYLRPIDDA